MRIRNVQVLPTKQIQCKRDEIGDGKTLFKRGCAIFTGPCINVISISVIEIQNVEILTVDIEKCTLTSKHKLSSKKFKFIELYNNTTREMKIKMKI